MKYRRFMTSKTISFSSQMQMRIYLSNKFSRLKEKHQTTGHLQDSQTPKKFQPTKKGKTLIRMSSRSHQIKNISRYFKSLSTTSLNMVIIY